MQKKFLAITLFSLLAMGGSALADDRGWRDQRDSRDRTGFRDHRDHRDHKVLLSSKQVSNRRGTVTLMVPKATRTSSRLELTSSDPDLVIRRVVLVDQRGRTTTLSPRRNGSIDLGASHNLRSVKITYQTRGRTRGAALQLFGTR